MATTISMPQLGESVTEGTISRWFKQEGEFVNQDEPLVEIITDKVTAEMPSPLAGTLLKIEAPEGASVQVGQEIALIQGMEKKPQSLSAEKGGQVPTIQAAAAATVPLTAVPTGKTELAARNGEKRATPMVRRLAREHSINLVEIQGTGIHGRITKEDIEKYIAQHRISEPFEEKSSVLAHSLSIPVPQSTREQAPASDGALATPPHDGEVLALTQMRRAIAEHMVRSKRTSPHALTVIEVDMTNVVKWRENIKAEFRRREGIDLTYVPFVMKATVEALKACPMLNSSWVDDKIILKKEINLAVAVSIDDGLVVPVVHRADEKSIAGLAKAVADVAARARSNKLTLADVQGGTFTLNNTGSYGSIISVPIINQPQAAILSMEAIQKRPVVINDAIAIRSMMCLCLSFDHRIIDGALAGRFLQKMKEWLEGFGPTTPLY